MAESLRGPHVHSETDAPSVEAYLDQVARDLRTQKNDYLDRVRTSAYIPLSETVEQILEAHKGIRSSIDFRACEDRRALYEAVRRYRRETMASVWRPVRDGLGRLELAEQFQRGRTQLRSARASIVETVPESVQRPEPADLYIPSRSDGWSWKAVSFAVRAWRTVQGWAGAEQDRMQVIPLSRLVTHHVETRLGRMETEHIDAVEHRLVDWVGGMEQEAVTWTHRLLDVERVLDDPGGHVQERAVRLPEASGDPTTGVMAPDLSALAEEVEARAAALQRCLAEGAAVTIDGISDAWADAIDHVVRDLKDAVDWAGTIRPLWTRSESGTLLTEPRQSNWSDWFDEVTERLCFLDAVATFRDDVTALEEGFIADVMGAGLAPVHSVHETVVEEVQSLRERVANLLDIEEGERDRGLVQAFDEEVERGTEIMEEALLARLRAHAPRRACEAVLAAQVDELAQLVDRQPEGFVVHPLSGTDGAPVEPGADAYVLPWKERCREVLDEGLPYEWRSALSSFVDALAAAPERATEIRAIVEFNLGAALQDVEHMENAAPSTTVETPYAANARELAVGGLDRAIEQIAREQDRLADCAGALSLHVWIAATRAWTDLHDRIRTTGQPTVHLFRLRGQLVRGTRWLKLASSRQVRATSIQITRTARRIQRQAEQLVRLGHAAVGAEAVDEQRLQRTVEILSSVDRVLSELPLVYRRLFSFRPVQDPDLLVAREHDWAFIERHANRWQRGLTDALILTGPAGGGRTSLLNCLERTTFRSAQLHSIELSDRLTDEESIARVVGRALGVTVDSTEAPTLAMVTEQLRAEPPPEELRICTIEHFEHLFQRTVGGTDLVARVLGFLSETDTRVLWIATTTDAAWQIVTASEPAAAGLVVRHRLTPMGRSDLEALILRRHRRSGLPLVFDAPEEATQPLLARRLRRAETEDGRQDILRREFFDRLSEVCGSNVVLALFYWARSLSLDTERATLHVKPIEPVLFSGLDTLPLLHTFALKALLEHGTLTVDELADVLGVSRATGRALLETLGNALVIAPAEQVEGPGVFRFATVEYETQYRIRPLVIYPVTRVLRSRNILHAL